MFKNRIAVAAGSVAAAMLAQILPTRDMSIAPKPTRTASGRRVAPSVAGRIPRTAAPRLKKPRTSGDFEAITRAELKRERKARKLRWDNSVHLATYYFTRDAVITAEALAVARELDANPVERAA